MAKLTIKQLAELGKSLDFEALATARVQNNYRGGFEIGNALQVMSAYTTAVFNVESWENRVSTATTLSLFATSLQGLEAAKKVASGIGEKFIEVQ